MGPAECSSCPLFERRKRIFVPSVFSDNPCGLAVVGEQPWTEEAKEGRPFVGRSGRLLDAVLARHGIDRARVHVLNAFSCFAGEIKDADKKKAWIACRARLAAELALIAPTTRAVLALGGTALSSLMGEPAKITEYIGAVISDLETTTAPVLPSYHPAAVLRSSTGCELAVLDAHVGKAARWLMDGPEPWQDAHTIARSGVEVAVAASLAGKTLAIDVETTGKNRFTCGLRTVGLGSWDQAVIIPCLEGERDEAGWPGVVEAVRRILTSPFVRKVFHNKGFDIPVLERHFGVPVVEPTDDTMVAHFTLHPLGNVLHGLAPAAGMYLDVPPWKKEHEGDYAEEPLEELALYNGRDVRITHALHGEVQMRLKAEGLERAYALQNDNVLLALEMSRNGIPVDLVAYEAAREAWSAKAARLYLDAYAMSGAAEAQIALYDRMIGSGARRLVGIKLTDYRAGSIDRSQLLELHDAVVYGAAVCLDRDDSKRLAKHADELGEILVDPEKWKEWNRTTDSNGERKGPHAGKLCQKVRSASAALVQAAQRIPFFNLDSDREVGIVLHERLGLAVMAPPNADGSYQTNEEALWHLKGHPFVTAWQGWKEAKKQKVWLSELPIYPDGRIHPSYKTTRIPTTRFASGEGRNGDPLEKLNAQNIEPRHLGMFRPAPGYGFVGADFCVAPSTPVLCADLVWRAAGDLKVGDELVGFDEENKGNNGRNRKFRRTVVEACAPRVLDCCRVVTTLGTVIASDEHQWLCRKVSRRYNATREWVKTKHLDTGDEIAFLAEPWDVDRTYTGGYLAGIYDGEGWIANKWRVSFGQNEGALFDYVVETVKDKGFDVSVGRQANKVMRVTICGGTGEQLRFLGTIRPRRLLEKAGGIWEGRSTWGSATRKAQVLAVFPAYTKGGGRAREVTALRTSTRTFIAGGFFCHNSTAELRVSATLSGCRTMLRQFEAADAGTDIKLHAQTARLIWPNEPAEKWSKGKLYDMAKRTNFLTIYGGGAGTLYTRIRELETPEADPVAQAEADTRLRRQCEAVIAMHKQVYPEIHETARRWYYDALRTGVLRVCYVTGHRYRFPVKDKQYISPTHCANAPVQGTTATIAHIAGRNLRRLLPSGARLLTYTHDFFLVECFVQQMQGVAELMRECMRFWLEGPAGGLWIPADPVIGWSWKEVK
jgi:uracil-DNA glycosylase family 4